MKQPEEMLGLSLNDVLLRMVKNKSTFIKLYQSFIAAGYSLKDWEYCRAPDDPQSRWYSFYGKGIVVGGKLTAFSGVHRDITERRQLMLELEYAATHDSLTGLPNRKMLVDIATERLKQQGAEGESCCDISLLIIDLDRFKEINDTLGHHAGDNLLRQIGPRLQAFMADYHGLVARLGGDEFGILLQGMGRQSIETFVSTLLEVLKEGFYLEGFQAEISASIGIACSSEHAADVGVLLRYADVAMYQAKVSSCGWLFYDEKFDPYSHERLKLVHDLGRAIRNNQLHLHFQPKVDLASGKTTSFEALLRWNHPEFGAVPPDEFIPLAEMTELIKPLTMWVLDRALFDCKGWHEAGWPLTVAVNISTRNLLTDDLVEQVQLALNRYQLPASALELEITESTIMTNPQKALEKLQNLRDLGIRLAIDDYGTGYSSLAYLKQLPVDVLKIDYSFVSVMQDSEADLIIVNSTINLAHNLGLAVIAEGVENRETLGRLKLMACDEVQGYYLAKPMPGAQVIPWLAESI